MAYTPTQWKDRAVQYPKRYFLRDNGGSDKNLLPPFNEGWTLHENTRMQQANFFGKVSGDNVDNPHKASAIASTFVAAPSNGGWVERTSPQYAAISALGGATGVTLTSVNGQYAEHLFSFNLIEHVIRTYGVERFGVAVTTAERVEWLKANVSKLVGNWWGFGSSPSGNNATLSSWNSTTNAWLLITNHLSGTITKQSATRTDIANRIDASGFVHFLANADVSNGTVASRIETDYVELEVYMAESSVPQADYTLTLNATNVAQDSWYSLPVTSGLTYTVKVPNGGNANAVGRIYKTIVLAHDAAKMLPGSLDVPITFTVDSSYNGYVTLRLTSGAAGVCVFSNPQLELGTVATAFAPMKTYDVTQAAGIVTQAGTPINATNMNKLETALSSAAAIADSALLYSQTQFPASGVNLNTLTETGIYQVGNAVNSPSTSAALHVIKASTALYVTQTMYDNMSNRVWTRRNIAGTWSSWTRVSNETTIMPDGTNVNTLTENGKYYAFNGANAPIASIGFYYDVIVHSSSYITQTAYLVNENRVFSRRNNNGTWTAWAETYSSYFMPVVSGAYVGNDAASRDIALPFTPSMVWIDTTDRGSEWGGMVTTAYPSRTTAGGIPVLVIGTNKFTVGYSGSSTFQDAVTNFAPVVYQYIAFR